MLIIPLQQYLAKSHHWWGFSFLSGIWVQLLICLNVITAQVKRNEAVSASAGYSKFKCVWASWKS